MNLTIKLLNTKDEIPYLQELRNKIYMIPNFQELVRNVFLRIPKVREALYPWLVKLMYYAFGVYK